MTNFLLKVLLLSVLLWPVTAGAQEEVSVGTGLSCNTPAQVRTIIEMANSGATSQAALEEVNASAPKAFGVLRVAYIRGETVGQVRFKDGLANITSILVVAVQDDTGRMQAVPPTVQFTIFPSADREV